MTNLTVKQAAHWLSEAWGKEIKTRDVRLRGNWLFWHDREYCEVDCIHNPKGGDLWAEAWTGISLEKSPWLATTETLNETLATLDKGIAKYINEINKHLNED
tara:strand:+ start:631 stop:936 length:306 start_codon:yes stop_codon:yes gene_type:complete